MPQQSLEKCSDDLIESQWYRSLALYPPGVQIKTDMYFRDDGNEKKKKNNDDDD